MSPIIKKYIELSEEQQKHKIGSFEWLKIDIDINDHTRINFKIEDWEMVMDFYGFISDINYQGNALDLVDRWQKLQILK